MKFDIIKTYCKELLKKTQNRHYVYLIAKEMLVRDGYKITDEEKLIEELLGPEYFEVQYIAFRVGLDSSNPATRVKAIKEIVSKIKLEPWESKDGQFTKTVIDKVNQWLEDKKYPTKIPWKAKTGRQLYYKVWYSKK